MLQGNWVFNEAHYCRMNFLIFDNRGIAKYHKFGTHMGGGGEVAGDFGFQQAGSVASDPSICGAEKIGFRIRGNCKLARFCVPVLRLVTPVMIGRQGIRVQV